MATIEKAEFRNWVKSSLSLRHTKDGLVDIADKKANSLREDIETAVEARCKAAVQNTCTKCTYELVIKAKKGKGVNYYMNCNICNHWITTIQTHAKANHKLEWSNCDPQKWPHKSWEIVKVFMGYGCNGSRSAHDIDCSNLMTMMMGCTYFHGLFTDITILQEIKNIRNGVMHSGSLEVNEGDMKSHLSKMIELLENSFNLKQDNSCKEAVDKIKQLKDDTLSITISKADEQRELTYLVTELQKEVGDLKQKNIKITEDVQNITDSQASFSISHDELKRETENNLTLIERKHYQCIKLIDIINESELPDIKKKLLMLTDELKSLNDDTKHDLQRLYEKFKEMGLRQSKTEQNVEELTSQHDFTKQKVEGLASKQNLTEQKFEWLASKQNLTEEKVEGLASQQNLTEQKVEGLASQQDLTEQKVEVLDSKQNLTEHKVEGLTSQHDFTKQKVEGLTSKQNLTEQKVEGLASQQYLTEQTLGHVKSDFQRLKRNTQVKAEMKTNEEKKLELQRHLIELYENDHSSMSVYPLKPHLTRKLDKMYVAPEMVEKNPRGQTKPQPDLADRLEHTKGQSDRKIGTLKDVFFKDGKLCKNIYVTGEAGIGKSTFCKYIVRMWLKAHSNQTENTSSDSKVMKQFPLLFYVQLRGLKLDTEIGEWAKLIKKQLNLNDSLDNFFSNDNSLIILDSLDEIASGLPFRGVLDKSTRLTTSRPWKLEASRENIYGNEIDRQIEIVCIGETSAETLVQNILPVLAEESANGESTNVSERDSQSFITEMKNKNLVSFLRIPVLLIQVLCLWYDDNLAEDESQSSIYKKLLCYQIKLSKISRKISQDKYNLLCCKSLKCPCNNVSDIVVKLGKLAFSALVSENRKNELIFDHNITEMHGLSKEDIDTCLKIGCLSKHKLFGKITDDPKMYVSFVHKTNQEYFASIYVAYEGSNIKYVLESAIGNLDKMLELEKVLMFVSGLHPEKGLEMATLLLAAVEADPRVLEYRHIIWSRHDDLVSNVQNAILAAIEECRRSNKLQLNLPLMDIVVNNKNMSSVSSFLGPRVSPIASIRIKSDYNRDYIPAEDIFTLIDASLLQKVALSCCTIIGATVTQLIHRSLCALCLSPIRMSHADLSGLCSQLAAAENLREVQLSGLECETHGRLNVGRCLGLRLDLGGLWELRKLDIALCGDVSALVLSPHMSHLQNVALYYVTTTAAIVRKLVDSLPRNNVHVILQFVTIRHVEDAPSPDAILYNIHRSCTVEDDGDVMRKENGDLWVRSFRFRYK